MSIKHLTVAVLIPCYNEEAGIARVVHGFRKVLPHALVYVYDNNSIDQTCAQAQMAGAIVRHEKRQGKGHVVRRMFADIEADVYLMVDGDETYDPNLAPTLIEILTNEHLDMVIAARRDNLDETAHRFGHRLGNLLFNKALKFLFNSPFHDIFSGYRCFSKRFVKSFPAMARGFDTETEMCVHALELGLPVKEVEGDFLKRAEGSESKLNAVRDGIKIFTRMVVLVKEIRPLVFFTAMAVILMVISGGLAYPLIRDFLITGLVPRMPTAMLTVGIAIMSVVSLTCGLILDSVSRGRKEIKRLAYLALPGIQK